MPGEKLSRESLYLPPDRDHTQVMADRQRTRLGTRFWAPFDDPDALIDPAYWPFLFGPANSETVHGAIVSQMEGQQEAGTRFIWSTELAEAQLLTRSEQARTLIRIVSALGSADEALNNSAGAPVRWVRVYAYPDRPNAADAVVEAGAFSRLLVESDIDAGSILTVVAVHEDNGEQDYQILTDEQL